MLQDFEPDQQNYITFPEFLSLVARKMKDTVTDEELLEAFKVFDKDGSGFINAAELRNYMCKLGEPQTDDEIDDLIKECVVNSEGKINYVDFVQSLMPKQ
ncbi:hypothetical protein IMG5_154530 [Ichthyophthirius multifiliis]|uniref:Calmodulin n=1 Tax=Ichthyophthirius multifiliis TaxID=5932 RepID=G0QZ56_ICHMU|nr:hypothetical protein IMG5_154530 [Ichthyophthirius multifiliis]EGR29508.1 hypothetical protein IMG5_154530 [Ichthyophthirius multifiliis]|eukprot:XP_004030744.1 hypothetical protein IMG5_154530 [Ichthyophthirius multifiliis]